MRKLIALCLVLFSFTSNAQTANDLVLTWLSQNNITAQDYQTCRPSLNPVVGTDGICVWGNDLGPQPTVSQLQALIPTWQAMQTAKANAVNAQAAYNVSIAAGLTVTSTSAPNLNGTYAIDPNAIANIIANRLSILADGVQSNGQATMSWADMAGTFHSFDIAHFSAFATAVKQYVAACKMASITQAAGGTPTWPTAFVTIL